jgi:CDP-paratose 2-epimerase
MECVTKIEALLGRKIQTQYVEQARKGDHICYISDLSKLQAHYPGWRLTYDLDQILEELVRT